MYRYRMYVLKCVCVYGGALLGLVQGIWILYYEQDEKEQQCILMKTFGYDYSSAGILSSVKKYIVSWVN